MSKTYKPEFTQEDFNILCGLLNIVVKVKGMEDNTDIIARNIIYRISQAEVKETEEKETPLTALHKKKE